MILDSHRTDLHFVNDGAKYKFQILKYSFITLLQISVRYHSIGVDAGQSKKIIYKQT